MEKLRVAVPSGQITLIEGVSFVLPPRDQPIVVADDPALGPRNCCNAGLKSLPDSSCKYSSGSTSVMFGDLRADPGRIVAGHRNRGRPACR